MLCQLRKIGIKNLERRIRFEKMITPADWENHYEVYRGATFNLAHTLGQMLHLRPRNRFEDLESVYLVGGGTHPGSGLPVIYESARITSRLLLQDFAHDTKWLDRDEVVKVPEIPGLAWTVNALSLLRGRPRAPREENSSRGA